MSTTIVPEVRSRWLAKLSLVFVASWGTLAASAELILDLDASSPTSLLLDTPGQVLTFSLENTDTSPDPVPITIAGLDLALDLPGGGPRITAMDALGSGLLFNGTGAAQFPDPGNTDHRQFWGVSDLSDPRPNIIGLQTVGLFRLTVDTTGVSAGSYLLNLFIPGEFVLNTQLTDQFGEIVPGFSSVNRTFTIVPEPGEWALMAGLGMVVWAACRRARS